MSTVNTLKVQTLLMRPWANQIEFFVVGGHNYHSWR